MARCLLLVLLFMFPLVALAAPDYVGSESCTECHRDIAERWAGSHHALAWTEAGPDTVLADFDGTSFELGEMSAAFRLSDGAYGVTVTETDGGETEYEIHSVVDIIKCC